MGAKNAKADAHVLHYHKADENKLWMYFPSAEKFRCYPVMYKGTPFFFGGLETISVPAAGAVFVVGGLWADHNKNFATVQQPEIVTSMLGVSL